MQDSNPWVFDYEVEQACRKCAPSEKLSLFAGEANSQFIVKVLILKLKYNVFQDKDDNQKSENSQSLCL